MVIIGTGTPVSPGDEITAEKINLKLENVETDDIVDGAVTTAKLADSAVTPAKADTSAAWNFTNTSSTFGNVKGTLQIDAIELAASAGANNFSWNITFSSTPKAVATPVNTSSTGLSWSFSSVTTSGGTFNISAASTVNIIGIAGF